MARLHLQILTTTSMLVALASLFIFVTVARTVASGPVETLPVRLARVTSPRANEKRLARRHARYGTLHDDPMPFKLCITF